MAAELKLAPPLRSKDTIDVLEQLLADAQAGRLIGLAYIATYCAREYTADVTGEARRNPVTTRGMLQELDDKLAEISGR